MLKQIRLNKDETEDAGYCKIDILSNRGLAQIAEICPERPFTAYPTRDAATERIFAKGDTIGITFGESRGMRKLFVEMQPRNVEEIAIALALIRPAAASEGRKLAFIEQWHALNRSSNTGLQRPIVFDDDAILKVKRALNCDSAEADQWRKAFAKGNAKARVDLRLRLLKDGYDRELVDTIIDDMNQLVYYSFCKSHALSYAQLVWALAYWKSHRPHEFWCAAINHCHSEYRKWVHYREARCSGLLLSREPPPYKVGSREGSPALISLESTEQTLLKERPPLEQMLYELKELGYWTSEEFLPTCGLWKESQQRLDGQQLVRFRGLVATGRVVHRNGNTCTLLCIGVDNREFIDCVIPKKQRHDLFQWRLVEGTGLLKSSGIECSSIRGVSLQSLQPKRKLTGKCL